jgi:hypothetical protein
MLFFNYTKPKMIVAEKGKHIKSKDDVYYKDEETGEEHFPYYSTTIFVPDSFTEEQMNELYVEENVGE